MASSILLVDDDLQGLESTRKILELESFQVDVAKDGQEALEKVRSKNAAGAMYDLVITDVRMPKMSGLEFLRALQLCGLEVPVVLMTAFGRVEEAVWAMKIGAVDFLTKPFKRHALLTAVRAALQKAKPKGKEQKGLNPPLQADDLVGESQVMEKLKQQISQVAATPATILLTGESGTGKEKIARLIHQKSSRAKQPFLAINCAAMPEALIESELFGFEKGSFTGAYAAHRGMFEAADGGTLLLDEVGDMPLSLQGKLLRVLQENEVRRVGSTQSIRVNVRIIAATHQDLRQRVAEGKFRQDLLYRLEVIALRAPALRERVQDIPLLSGFFLSRSSKQHDKKISVITPEVLRIFSEHSWPGNVRELSNVIERAVILAEGLEIHPQDLPAYLRDSAMVSSTESWIESIQIPVGTSLKQVEDLMIKKTLEATEGDKNLAAKLLGLTSRTIYRKLERT